MTPAERSEWASSPYTRYLKEQVGILIGEIKSEWAEGKFTDRERDAYARGRIAGLLEIFEIE